MNRIALLEVYRTFMTELKQAANTTTVAMFIADETLLVPDHAVFREDKPHLLIVWEEGSHRVDVELTDAFSFTFDVDMSVDSRSKLYCTYEIPRDLLLCITRIVTLRHLRKLHDMLQPLDTLASEEKSPSKPDDTPREDLLSPEEQAEMREHFVKKVQSTKDKDA